MASAGLDGGSGWGTKAWRSRPPTWTVSSRPEVRFVMPTTPLRNELFTSTGRSSRILTRDGSLDSNPGRFGRAERRKLR